MDKTQVERDEKTTGSQGSLSDNASFLYRHIVIILIASAALAVGGLAWRQSVLQDELLRTSAVNSVQLYVDAIEEFRSQYTAKVASKIAALPEEAGITVTHDYDLPHQTAIPLPATLSMELGKALAKDLNGGQIALYSKYPFPYEGRISLEKRDQFAQDAWENLTATPETPYVRFEEYAGQPVIRYAVADRMRQACVNCHNTHKDTPKTGWKTGDVRGVLEVTLPMQALTQQTQDNLQGFVLWLGAITIAGVGIVGLVIGRLRRLPTELEGAVVQRTKELADARQQIEKRADELARSNRELDSFAYIASHDLKAPLRGIENLANFVIEDAGDQLPDECQSDLHLMQRRIQRMNGLLDDLLAYSRVGRKEGAPVEVDTREVVEDIVEMLNLPDGFTVEVTSEMPTIHTPRAAIHTVLRNLISNAIKHHDRDDGRVEVSATDLGKYVQFEVKDDGPGIPSHLHQQAFAMFKTLKRRDEVEGSGMGLTLVKKAVEMYSGKIELESEEGQGATFRFTWSKRFSDDDLSGAESAESVHQLKGND